MELYIACSSAPLPTAAEIQQRALELGLSVVIAPIDWERQSGFMPVVINSRDSGVEVDTFPASQMGETLAAFSNQPAERVIAFRWGGDLAELACAYALAGAIASIVDGAILDPQSGEAISTQTAVDEANEALKAVS